MDKWAGKVAVVTGASAGIGAAICVEFAKNGLTVVGLARRKNRIEQLAADNKVKIHALECDVTNPTSIDNVFAEIEKKFGAVDVLVNNAGTFRKALLLDLAVPDQDLNVTIETNLKGLIQCTRRAFKTMKEQPLGYIININSVAGHLSAGALPPDFGLNIYGATKHAVTQTTEVTRLEIAAAGNRKIRVSVRTSIFNRSHRKTKSSFFSRVSALEP